MRGFDFLLGAAFALSLVVLLEEVAHKSYKEGVADAIRRFSVNDKTKSNQVDDGGKEEPAS